MSKITIKDIARAAGVSRGTVDRVINGRGNVKAEKRDRILQIADQIGYEKNLIASTLAINKTHQIAVVLPAGVDSYWKQIRLGVQAAMRNIGQYGVEITYFDFDYEVGASYENQLMEALNITPAAILTAPLFKMETIRFARIVEHNNIPFFTINTEQEIAGITSYVGQNSKDAGKLAGSILTLRQKALSEILVITIGSDSTNAQHTADKITGLQQYLNANSIHAKIKELYIEDKQKLNESVEDLLTTKSNIKSIWFTNSQAYTFFKIYQKSIKPDVIVLGFDIVTENVQLLESGKLSALFNQNPSEQSFRAMMQIYDLLINKVQPPRSYYLPIDIVLKENLAAYIKRDESLFQNDHKILH
ncbi:MAG TPA: LacI family DNA-binding transcriptional regulator [Saprospiraceae bacterium]|nr:LacI family DNA-binding transcriptional regulator [Saprospiraceae bacterium]HPN71084.1 LacI family DNA-binding transcriptional regulator [Saprospiraceae bacterium]